MGRERRTDHDEPVVRHQVGDTVVLEKGDRSSNFGGDEVEATNGDEEREIREEDE